MLLQKMTKEYLINHANAEVGLDLEKTEGKWKIIAMTFNFKYQDGNIKLIEKAIEQVKLN